MIIAHLTYDTHGLLACSLTCRSWYAASVSHLHHTLSARAHRWSSEPEREWPKPLQNASKLGLLPLVRKFQVRRNCRDYVGLIRKHCIGLSPEWFNRCTLRQFSALTNVQTLEIDDLDIPNFVPKIRKYFGHFLPTVRSLSLRAPKGSGRQIIFFIGLFQYLEDLTLLESKLDPWESEPVDNLTVAPSSTPPLRGRLIMAHFTRPGLLEDMIHLFGGIRFRHMDLFAIDETQFLLSACANTLETLRLYPAGPGGEQLYAKPMWFPANAFTADSLRGLDLSRNKSLRTFEVVARFVVLWHGPRTSNITSNFLKTVLSTISSPTFSEVIVLYWDCDFSSLKHHLGRATGTHKVVTPDERAMEASWHHALFEVFREMHTVRDFKLFLCADVPDCIGECAVGELQRVVAAEKVTRGLDYLPSEPAVVYTRTPGVQGALRA